MSLQDAIAKRITSLQIYYTGPGIRENGEWVTYDSSDRSKLIDKINIHEIMNLVKDSKYKHNIEIVSDSNFSGEICHQAKAWMEENSGTCDIGNLFI